MSPRCFPRRHTMAAPRSGCYDVLLHAMRVTSLPMPTSVRRNCSHRKGRAKCFADCAGRIASPPLRTPPFCYCFADTLFQSQATQIRHSYISCNVSRLPFGVRQYCHVVCIHTATHIPYAATYQTADRQDKSAWNHRIPWSYTEDLSPSPPAADLVRKTEKR